MRTPLHLLLRFLVHVLTKPQVEGLENLPHTGPALLLINHTNFVDGPLILALVPRLAVPMMKVELFSIPVFGPLLRWYGAFPVRRGELDLQAFRSSFQVLRQGHVLLIAPEGTRSGDGRLQEGKHGTAYIAARMNAPLVPAAVTGGEHFYSNLSRLRRSPVRIVFGPAFRLRRPRNAIPRDALHQMTQEVMYQLARLLPPEQRGVYSDMSKATEDYVSYEVGQPTLAPRKAGRVAPAPRR